MQRFYQRIALLFVAIALHTMALSAADKQSKYNFKVSGFVNLTMSEDFNGSIDCYDFIPALIDVDAPSYNDTEFRMDFSTSRVNFDASTESKLGLVELHLDVDFRGGSEGSYTPRMRTGHIKIGNVMVGKTFSNFSDLSAMLPQVDFQGPVGYCFNYSPQIRYTHTLADDHLSLSASLEYLPQSLSTEIDGVKFERENQKLPTTVSYAQYNWGESNRNHLRLSAICRPQSVYNTAAEQSLSRVGWGTQVSGAMNLCSAVKFYYNAIYGEGITEYMNDTYGSHMEYTINPEADNGIETTPMFGGNVGAQITLSKSVWLDFAYAQTTIGLDRNRDTLYSADDYHQGTFVSGNIFYRATKDLTFASEYVWGERLNMGGDSASANRIYLMAQYNF